MVIMIDATNISVGGGLQVSISVITELFNNPRGKRVIYLVSSKVYEQLSIPQSLKDCVFSIDVKKRSVTSYFTYYMFMREIEKKYDVSLVFSIFGPTYWRPRRAKHLIGFANAWLVYPDTRAYEVYSPSKRLFMKLKNVMLRFMLYNKNSHYVTETNAVKDAFCETYKCSNNQIDVVQNCISQSFNLSMDDYFSLSSIRCFKFFTVTHNYPHKNLKIIPLVGKLLKKMNFDFVFIVTFPEEQYQLLNDDFKEYTHNIGPVDVSRCRSVYDNCDALFLPTLIECFTVSYLEALYSNKPILTSDLDFAHDICGDAAFYFDPYNVESVVNACAKVITSKKSDCSEINNKLSRYPLLRSNFKGNEHRVSAYMNIIDNLLGS
ncbi:glycosyltransferase [Aeromonas veronii]